MFSQEVREKHVIHFSRWKNKCWPWTFFFFFCWLFTLIRRILNAWVYGERMSASPSKHFVFKPTSKSRLLVSSGSQMMMSLPPSAMLLCLSPLRRDLPTRSQPCPYSAPIRGRSEDCPASACTGRALTPKSMC